MNLNRFDFQYVLVIAWFRVQLMINLTSGYLRSVLVFQVLDYHESNLSLIAREIMRLLVNHYSFQPYMIRKHNYPLEHSCYGRSQAIIAIILQSFLL